MELMLQYDAKIIYIKGNENSIADMLSHLPCENKLEAAEKAAQHPYSYCDAEDVQDTVASIYLSDLFTPMKAATSWQTVLT